MDQSDFIGRSPANVEHTIIVSICRKILIYAKLQFAPSLFSKILFLTVVLSLTRYNCATFQKKRMSRFQETLVLN